MKGAPHWFGSLIACLVMVADNCFGQAIEDVHMSRQAEIATAEVIMGCGMRYVGHQPKEAGIELRISLGLEPDCARVISSLHSELRYPRGGDMGAIGDVEFSRTTPDRATLIFHFQVPVRFNIKQGADFKAVRVNITRDVGATQAIVRRAEPPTRPSLPKPQPALPKTKAAASRATGREPLRLAQGARMTDERFVIQLDGYAEGHEYDRGGQDLSGIDLAGYRVYESRVIVGERVWRVNRIGFFPSELAARRLLQQLPSGQFPNAFIATASPAEQVRVSDASVAEVADSAPRLPGSETGLAAERIGPLMAEAKDALREGRYAESIRIYGQLLQQPDTGHREEALEFLGLARERNGEASLAQTDYETYLAEFPNSPGTNRVRQRLAGLPMSSTTIPRVSYAPSQDLDIWQFDANVAQYYRRDIIEPVSDAPAMVQQSAIVSQTDALLRRQGERFDFTGRLNGAYYYDLEQTADTTGDQGHISYAYFDFVDRDLDLSARIGRQSQYTGGVLGRYDGARIRYRWRPNVAIDANLGFPTDSPRAALSTRRFFYGLSVDFENIAEHWDFSTFFHIQDVDGIADRQAVGGEIRYLHGNWNLIATTDFDLSYNVLNSALVAATWQPSQRVSVNGRVNFGTSPFIATRNAIIGQNFTTVETLQSLYTEGQIRRIARDRTAQAGNGAVGISFAAGEKFRINADAGYSFLDSTVASAGVASVPETRAQTFLSVSAIGSSLLKTGDTAIFTLRQGTNRTSDTSTAIFDLRYPVGNTLRISPRLALSFRTNEDNTDQWIAQPNFRATWRWQRRFRLEIELGGLWSSHDLPPSLAVLSNDGEIREEATAYYVNAGYWMDF